MPITQRTGGNMSVAVDYGALLEEVKPQVAHADEQYRYLLERLSIFLVRENLNEAELMDWVERFYSEYYFRPRVIWRMVRKVIFNAHDRRRLTKEAREYLALRSRRRKFISEQRNQHATVSANAGD